PFGDRASASRGRRIVMVGGRTRSATVAALAILAPGGARANRAARRAARATRVDLYATTQAGMLSAAARAALPRIYVPNSESQTVDVIDPRTFKVVGHFAVGTLPQHVTPAYDMRTLCVDDDIGNTLTPIDPRTGNPGRPIPVDDPYNLYFTPGGRRAIVVAERLRRLDFRLPGSFRLERSVTVPCAGPNHL